MAKVFSPLAINRLELNIGSKKLGEIFLELGYLDQAKLNRALQYQRVKGGRLGWILATLGYISRLQLFEGLALHLSLPFEKNLNDIRHGLDRKAALKFTLEDITRYQAVPFYIQGKTVTILTAEPDNPDTITFIRDKFRTEKINQIVVTDLDIMKLSGELYRSRILDTSINGLRLLKPEESASNLFSNEQIAFAAGFLGMLGVLLFLDAGPTFLSVMVAAQIFFAVPLLFRLGVAVWGRLKHPGLTGIVSSKPINDYDLPVYSILVPAYQEKDVIGNLIKCLNKLDYPEDKLDIILLLEENDKATLEAAKAEKPPANWRFLVCPESLPKTKPKALNYGLNFARGEFLTIYDAEDLPEPDQLRKAVAAFRTHPDKYICFRASLNYYNKNENLLTRLFSLEYAVWYDCLMPGLLRLGLPVPLGGSSSHFNVEKLRKIGAWDPFNVTEDTDLGIRATVEGYCVGAIDSVTHEEANGQLNNWMRQRSRWVKGYLQTLLVQSRHPLKLIRSMGFFKWLSYTLHTGGTPAAFLLNPLIWVLLGIGIYLDVSGTYYVPSVVIYLAGLNLIVGNAIIVFIAILGAAPRKNRSLLPLVALSPVYWFMQSLAAYMGLWQLFTKPFYWEKTRHGLTKDIPVSRTLEIPENVPDMVVARGNRK